MCGYVREVDEQEESQKELKAVAAIIAEHKHWAKVFGAATILAMQGDYSGIQELALKARYDFIDGEPAIRSAAFEEARKVGIPC